VHCFPESHCQTAAQLFLLAILKDTLSVVREDFGFITLVHWFPFLMSDIRWKEKAELILNVPNQVAQ
jgi:hypothetical protein